MNRNYKILSIGTVLGLASAGLMYCKPRESMTSGVRSGEGGGGLDVTLYDLTNGYYEVQVKGAPQGDDVSFWIRNQTDAAPNVDCGRAGAIKMTAADYKDGMFSKVVDVRKGSGANKLETRADPRGVAKVDPDVQQFVTGPLSAEACSGDAKTGVGYVEAKPAATNGLSLAYEITDQGQECKAKLGPIPEFSCLDETNFRSVPITINGTTVRYKAGAQPGTGRWVAESDSGQLIGEILGTSADKCDRPNLLGGMKSQCLPDSRIGRLPKQPGFANVETVVICRRYYLSKPDAPQNTKEWRSLFSDVAIVQTNTQNGESCWFQMLAGSNNPGKDATQVPSPSAAAGTPEAVKSKNFWLTPQQTANIDCSGCHDSDQFIHTPYIDQRELKFSSDHPTFPDQDIVPRILSNPAQGRQRAYSVVGTQFFTAWPQLKVVEPTGSGNGLCVSCHRIGLRRGCGNSPFVADSIGRSFIFNSYRTNWSKSDQHADVKHWMPPNHGKATTAAWTQAYGNAAEAIDACCNNPFGSSCTTYDIPRSSEPPPPPPGETITKKVKVVATPEIPASTSYTTLAQPVLVEFEPIDVAGTVTEATLEAVIESTARDISVKVVAPNGRAARANGYDLDSLPTFNPDTGGTFQPTITVKTTAGNSAMSDLRNLDARGVWKLNLWDALPGENPAKLKSATLTLKIVPNTALSDIAPQAAVLRP